MAAGPVDAVLATAFNPLGTAVQRIFVNAAIKKALCREAKGDPPSPRATLPAQDTEQLSPEKTGSGHCTSATFTRSPGSPDFVVLCQLVPGK